MSFEAEISVMVGKKKCFTAATSKLEEPPLDVRSESPPLVRAPRTASPPPQPCYAPERDLGELMPSPTSRSPTASGSGNSNKRDSRDGVRNFETSTRSLRGGSSPQENPRQRHMDGEEEESIALARMLMAQEAMESYALSAEQLRYNEQMYSPEDLSALQAAMAEEEADILDEEGYDTEGELSYDAMLRLSETIGDVKKERWALVASAHISRLPTHSFVNSKVKEKDENDSSIKCLVCQCAYESGECLSGLPCGHCFHKECVDQWLLRTDICPYCRQSILSAEKSDNE